ncbi:MAG: hypothetical protein M3Q07_00835 [Pseudobdellovibrionaceae bacterium]|nr:hypothetical protein [Pseudobdellovibrionaceae bacterium]
MMDAPARSSEEAHMIERTSCEDFRVNLGDWLEKASAGQLINISSRRKLDKELILLDLDRYSALVADSEKLQRLQMERANTVRSRLAKRLQHALDRLGEVPPTPSLQGAYKVGRRKPA